MTLIEMTKAKQADLFIEIIDELLSVCESDKDCILNYKFLDTIIVGYSIFEVDKIGYVRIAVTYDSVEKSNFHSYRKDSSEKVYSGEVKKTLTSFFELRSKNTHHFNGKDIEYYKKLTIDIKNRVMEKYGIK